jgi:hypothetical protein
MTWSDVIGRLHPDVFPFSDRVATAILGMARIQGACSWAPECHDEAVRLGKFTIDGERFTLKFLCERHKSMGMYGGTPYDLV